MVQPKEKRNCCAEKRTPNFLFPRFVGCASCFASSSAASMLPIHAAAGGKRLKPPLTAQRLLAHRKEFAVKRRRLILRTPANCNSMPPPAARWAAFGGQS